MEEPDIERCSRRQLDPDACAMAQFRAREREAHGAHWERVLAADANVNWTIPADGQVAGAIGSFSTR